MSASTPLQTLAQQFRRLRHSPEIATHLLQLAKAVVAATVSWWVVVEFFDSQVPFLAPWMALVTVYPTVYQSLFRGVQSLVMSWLGVGLSFVVGYFLGVNVWTFGLALLVGMLCGLLPGLRKEGTTMATTAIFVLSSAFMGEELLVVDRIVEVGVGVAVGVAVNALLVPPLKDQQAAWYIDSANRKIGEVLIDMADEFSGSWETTQADDWHDRTKKMSEDLSSAWQAVRAAQESHRFNLRRHLPGPRKQRRGGRLLRDDVGGDASYQQILERTDEAVTHLRHLTRTLREATYADSHWDDRFRQRWSDIVRTAGQAIADPSIDVSPCHDQLLELAEDMSLATDLPTRGWPLYGSLLSSMLHIVVITGDVASTRRTRG